MIINFNISNSVDFSMLSNPLAESTNNSNKKNICKIHFQTFFLILLYTIGYFNNIFIFYNILQTSILILIAHSYFLSKIHTNFNFKLLCNTKFINTFQNYHIVTPMCMGFGCNAAGVVGTRIIESPRERIIASVTNAFVPCNGRYPFLIAIATIFIAGNFSRNRSFCHFYICCNFCNYIGNFFNFGGF